MSPTPLPVVTSSLGSPPLPVATPRVPTRRPGVPCRPGAPGCSPVARCSARQAARSAGQDAAAMGTRGPRGAPVAGEEGAGLPPPAPRPCPQPAPQCPPSRTAPGTTLSPPRGPLSWVSVPVSPSLSPGQLPSPGIPSAATTLGSPSPGTLVLGWLCPCHPPGPGAPSPGPQGGVSVPGECPQGVPVAARGCPRQVPGGHGSLWDSRVPLASPSPIPRVSPLPVAPHAV